MSKNKGTSEEKSMTLIGRQRDTFLKEPHGIDFMSLCTYYVSHVSLYTLGIRQTFSGRHVGFPASVWTAVAFTYSASQLPVKCLERPLDLAVASPSASDL